MSVIHRQSTLSKSREIEPKNPRVGGRIPRNGASTHVAGGAVRLRLEASEDAAAQFYKRQFHPSQRIEAELPGGETIVSFEVESLDAAARLLDGWGSHVRVLEPSSLARS